MELAAFILEIGPRRALALPSWSTPKMEEAGSSEAVERRHLSPRFHIP